MSISNQNPNILVVDDDEVMRDTIKRALSDVSLSVSEASSTDEAIQMFDAKLHDAVILDMHLPGESGFAVCKKIRGLPGGQFVPIMVSTPDGDRRTVEKAYDVGATDFLPIPVNTDILGHRIRYLIRHSKTYAELHDSRIRLHNAKRVAEFVDWSWDMNAHEHYWSPELLELLEIVRRKPVQHQEEILKHVYTDDRPMVKSALKKLYDDGEGYDLEYRLVTKSCKTIHVHDRAQLVLDDNGFPEMILGTMQNITKRKEVEEKFRHLAFHDSLTGLPNRSAFTSYLDTALAKARRYDESMALLFLDLDDFKRINDSLGHNVGDEILKEVANRLLECLRDSDCIGRTENDDLGASIQPLARLGGDEFIVLLHDVTPSTAAVVARRIISVIHQPIVLPTHDEAEMSVSVGIALYPSDGKDTVELFKHSDSAMYHAKNTGKNNFCFYDDDMNETALRRFRIAQELKRAVTANEFFLLFQPKVSLDEDILVGAEALVRWLHPEMGLVLPEEFISVAEEINFINILGMWIIEESCRQAKAWTKQGLDLAVAVNVSARQLNDEQFVEVIEKILTDTALDPHYLTIELTESTIIDNYEDAVRTLKSLKALGVRIHIDDFGVGFSYLRCLSEFPLDGIKLHRSFIANIPDCTQDAVLVQALISLAHNLNIEVVAEGVETEQHLRFLHEVSCDQAQGYYFSMPVSAKDLLVRFGGDEEDSGRIRKLR